MGKGVDMSFSKIKHNVKQFERDLRNVVDRFFEKQGEAPPSLVSVKLSHIKKNNTLNVVVRIVE